MMQPLKRLLGRCTVKGCWVRTRGRYECFGHYLTGLIHTRVRERVFKIEEFLDEHSG